MALFSRLSALGQVYLCGRAWQEPIVHVLDRTLNWQVSKSRSFAPHCQESVLSTAKTRRPGELQRRVHLTLIRGILSYRMKLSATVLKTKRST